MKASASCEKIHHLLEKQPRFEFNLPFGEMPPNGVYFIFERGQLSHGNCDRIVRVGSHREPNRLAIRLRQHITSYGASIFRRHLGVAFLSKPPRPAVELPSMKLWDQPLAKRRKQATAEGKREVLDRFDADISAFIAKTFTFCVVGTSDSSDAMALEKACITTVFRCDHCRSKADPSLRPENGFLWNIQHANQTSSIISDRQLEQLSRLAKDSSARRAG